MKYTRSLPDVGAGAVGVGALLLAGDAGTAPAPPLLLLLPLLVLSEPRPEGAALAAAEDPGAKPEAEPGPETAAGDPAGWG